MNLILNFWHCGGCLIITSGSLRSPSSTRHKPTKHNDQDRATAEKARRRLKYGDTRRLSVFAVFFYAAAIYCFF